LQTTEAHEHLLNLSHDSKETLTNSEIFEVGTLSRSLIKGIQPEV